MLDILTIIKEYGWTGLLAGFLLYFAYRSIAEIAKAIGNKAKESMTQKKYIALKKHVFFNSMDYALNVEIHGLSLFHGKPIRQALLRDLMYCALVSMEEVSERIAEMDQSNWTDAEWIYQIKNQLNDMNVIFVARCIKMGIPEVVYNKFAEWHYPRLDKLRTMVDNIVSNGRNPTAETKTSSLFMLFNLFISVMMGDCKRTLQQLNGDITNMQYKGGLIEPLGEHGSTH